MGRHKKEKTRAAILQPDTSMVSVFHGEWDEEGVFFYQAFNHEIADWALETQHFGGPMFKPARMTWIKPSFAWALYRAGYGTKHHQERILKIKLPHIAVASLLEQCTCKEGGGGSNGRVQWDPERDLFSVEPDGKSPRKMLRRRAIQIGLKGVLSEEYVASAISITDVSKLAQKVQRAHNAKNVQEEMKALASDLPHERPYMPHCSDETLARLGLVPGDTADWVAGIGRGEVETESTPLMKM